MRKHIRILLPTICIFQLFCSTLTGQENTSMTNEEKEKLAVMHINNLKEGALIVLLPTNNNKLAAIQKLLDGGELKDKTAERLEKEKAQTIQQNNNFNKRLILAFQKNYDFSEVRFITDTVAHQLTDGNIKSLFVDETLQVDPSITIDEGPVYFLRIGSTQKDQSQNLEAMILTDKQLNDLRAPFPYYARLNHFGAFMGSIFPSENQAQRNVDKSVSALNKSLEKFMARRGKE